ncbi:MAG: VTT domain-containing protein [Desulfuromonadales bacterium]|nr:VTT domain-containing protein [Desulfuromonadales bacterium]
MFFRQGENCKQLATANRAAFLVDGADYFAAVADACTAARKVVYIVGWDIDSRIRLRRGLEREAETFGAFIDRIAGEKPGLQIYILEWDFAMIYSLERELWPLLSLGWKTHERVHFSLDDEHPPGASHHQKIVVVDDRIAFVGGIDLAICRWDTTEHAPDHPDRADNHSAYAPFHDMQMLVDGDAATALAGLVRERWERATGDRLEPVEISDHDPWPENIVPDLGPVEVALLRTRPRHDGEAEVREIERFYLDAIEQARSSIYIENQYLTSHVIGTALENVLLKEDGPELLLVLPKQCSGWLEQETMGALRQRLLGRLREADVHGRLRACYPDREGLGDDVINVHSKILIVDDALLTIGSANLSNRSMGFDTECNLALSAEGDKSVAQGIAGLRNRLLAEHLGTGPEQVAERLAETGSLLATVDALCTGRRRLKELRPVTHEALAVSLSADRIVDPERPISLEELLDYLDIDYGEQTGKMSIRKKAWRFAGVIAAAGLLAILWRWSPLSAWLNLNTLLAAATTVRESPLAVPIVLAIYLAGSCVMFPVTLMILATALSFGPYLGFFLALGGSLLGGVASYLLGRWLGRDVVRKLAGEKVNRLSRKLARRGWLAIAVVRVVPIAPYTIVNLVAGASHISTRSFLIGTAVGMGPGILAIMLFEGGLERAIRDPGWGSLTIAALAIVCAVLVLIFGRRWLTRQDQNHDR